jgi:hypothetical protein
VLALAAAHDRRAAASTRTTGAAVDDAVDAVAVERGAHQTRRLVEHGEQVAVGGLAEAQPGRETHVPERLGAPDVADPRHEPLVEERLAELPARIGRTQPLQDAAQIGRIGEDVGTEALHRPPGQVDDPSPEHGLMLAAPEHEPGQAGHLRTAREHAPAPGHAQVAAHDEPALEAEEEVLAARLGGLEHAPVDPFRDAERPRAGMERLDVDPVADEHLQPARRAVEGIAFGHVGNNREVGRVRSAAAGAVAAGVWALQEPLDQLVFGHDYSDVAMLGKLVTRGPGWWGAGLGVHMANGALFGLAYGEARRRLRVDPHRLALGMALGEHLVLFSLGGLVDRYHPARGEPGLARLLSSRAFVQATWRHTLFGWTLGRLA